MVEHNLRPCSLCDGEVTLEDIDGHWLQLYCPACDKQFQRAASKDMNGFSAGDLRNITDFTTTE